LIVVPGAVFGPAKNKLVESRISAGINIVFKYFMLPAKARGRTPVVGEGKNIWAAVEIDDCESEVGMHG
jgi:hypothetical protein